MTIEINPDEISVHYANQPAGGYGFRTGNWTVFYQGQKYIVFTSVPHCIDIADQYRKVERAAAREITKLLNGGTSYLARAVSEQRS